MEVINCPLYDNAFYSYTIGIKQETRTLRFRYNSRSDKYFMDILDAEENPILLSTPLVPLYGLVDQYALPSLGGDFYLLPIETSGHIGLEVPDNRHIYETHYLMFFPYDKKANL